MQRLFDIVLSGLALLVLSPLFLLIAFILRFTGEREVLFLQPRVGRDGRPFNVYKFVTMLKDSPNIGTGTVTLPNDPRILPVGRFLRKTKFNELPQLLNVLFGDMSMIGPRPQTQRCFDAFSPDAQATITKVRPGLSGLGSIVFRDEEEMLRGHADPGRYYDEVIMPYKSELEAWYVDHQGLWTYFRLIILTLWVIIFPRSQIVWRCFPSLPEPPSSLQPFFDNKASGR